MSKDTAAGYDYCKDCVELLQQIISVPSFSNEEDDVADVWQNWLTAKGVKNVRRYYNNVYALNFKFNPKKPILLLNSHLDTVKPASGYTYDPFSAEIQDGKLYGLGSNDAGASGVTLASTFLKLYFREDLSVNLLLAITASEERMGEHGMRAFLPHLKEMGIYPDMAIVGEPTGLKPAIAERGLVVLDAETKGKAGHAARNEGINAIYKAIEDIESLRNFEFPKQSALLGPIKVSVTVIEAGKQHNVVPDRCHFVVDVRTTDAYSNSETVEILQRVVKNSTLTPRSTRIQSSVLDYESPLYKSFEKIGLTPFVSPTTSDMALMHDIPSLKIGPGESSRSHTADEYVLLSEIKDALDIYPKIIENIKF